MTGEAADRLTGSVLGGTYRVLRLLNRGGMGAVYEAENIRLRKKVAVKVLSNLSVADPSQLHRFYREARIATELAHPHIVEVHDFNETEEHVPYMVIELLEGHDLEAELVLLGTLPPERTVFIVRQICAALHVAHRHQIVHRDLKPGNVFLCRNRDYPDFVKVLDFGISKVLDSVSLLTTESALVGTPQFLAPEQVEGPGDRVGPWTDVFALGVLLYRMLAGKVPFEATTLPALLYAIVNEDSPSLAAARPELPAALSEVVARALARSVEDRWRSVRELSAALLAAAPEGLGPLAGAEPWEEAAAREAEPVDALASTSADSSGSRPRRKPASAASSTAPVRRGALGLKLGLAAAGLALLGGGVILGLRAGSSRGGDAVGSAPARAREADAQGRARAHDAALRHDLARAGAGSGSAVAAKVRLTLGGSPRGAKIVEVASGQELGTLPGSVELPRGTLPVKLRITHPGFQATQRTVVPAQDATLPPVRLRPAGSGPGPDPERVLPKNPHER